MKRFEKIRTLLSIVGVLSLTCHIAVLIPLVFSTISKGISKCSFSLTSFCFFELALSWFLIVEIFIILATTLSIIHSSRKRDRYEGTNK